MATIYLLKDLARLSGFSIHTIKYYLKIGLLKETGRFPESRFRYFDTATVEQLQRIRQHRKEDKSLRQIRELLCSQTPELQGSR